MSGSNLFTEEVKVRVGKTDYTLHDGGILSPVCPKLLSKLYQRVPESQK